ncbi:MAG: VOC family protein, partial [Muribaculaceae bacterium]
MRIEHMAIWADDLEMPRALYTKYFNLKCGSKYTNQSKNYTSYFLSFGEDKIRIELMHIPDMQNPASRGYLKGLAHFAIAVGNTEKVNTLTGRLRADGYTILSEPRTTGDGYYESAVADSEAAMWKQQHKQQKNNDLATRPFAKSFGHIKTKYKSYQLQVICFLTV